MRMSRSLLLAVFATLPALAPAWAHAQAVRSSSRGAGIAILERLPQYRWRVRFAASGREFVEVDTGAAWVLDAFVTRRNTLLLALASGDGRRGPIRVVRVDPAGGITSETSLADTHGAGEYRFAESGGRLRLLSSRGGWVSVDDGASFGTSGRWRVDGYGFYAVSVATTGPGTSFVSPDFNTCHSSDSIESATLVHLAGPVATQRQLAPERFGRGVFALHAGRHGVVYSMSRGPEVCRLSATASQRTRAIFEASRDGICDAELESNGRFTVAVIEGEVVRVRGASVVRLGRARSAGERVHVYPDARGRALVLSITQQGAQLARHGRGRAPVRLL